MYRYKPGDDWLGSRVLEGDFMADHPLPMVISAICALCNAIAQKHVIWIY